MTNRQSRTAEMTSGIVVVLLVAVIAVFAGSPSENAPNTLEDIYGDTGNTFQAAIGFVTMEGSLSSIAKQSYGLSLDDMVVKWREFSLEPDETDCAESGSCAVVELATTNVFRGQSLLTISVIDAVPDPENDCDLDGVPDGVTDCNNNTIDDVVVKATSEADIVGEIIFLDNVGGDLYSGTLATSAQADSPGVLYLAPVGSPNPTVTVTYLDNDIDPGPGVEVCPNDVNPSMHGLVQAFTTVLLGSSCEVVVVSTETTDNGDGDEFVDTEETAQMQVCLINNCGVDLHDCTGRLFSNSPNVDCILDSIIDVGDLPDTSDVVCVGDSFRWKMADVNRADPDVPFDAEFGFTMTCDEIDSLSVTQELAVALDLDFDLGGQTPVAWTEGFESGLPSSSELTDCDSTKWSRT